jgi:phosphohistidine phosphatase SixA
MNIIVARHGFSAANDRDQYGTPAFANPAAPLMPQGIKQASDLGKQLVSQYGIDLEKEPVAVSMMRRAQETAIAAGFRWLHIYPTLNEEKGDTKDQDMQTVLAERRPPDATRKAAQYLIANPPKERVWVTHGLLIATLCQELNIYQDVRFTPKFCEIREISLQD